MLTAVSADVLAAATPLASFLPSCSSLALSALIDSSWVIPEVSSMSSLELRSALLVIQVRTLWLVNEKATAPPIWMVALAPEPPAPALAVYLAETALKMLSKALEPRSHITSGPRIVEILGGEPGAGAGRVGGVERRPDAEGEERGVEDLGRAQREAASSRAGCTVPSLMRAMPPRVSFSSAPSWIVWPLTRRWSPIRLNWSTADHRVDEVAVRRVPRSAARTRSPSIVGVGALPESRSTTRS